MFTDKGMNVQSREKFVFKKRLWKASSVALFFSHSNLCFRLRLFTPGLHRRRLPYSARRYCIKPERYRRLRPRSSARNVRDSSSCFSFRLQLVAVAHQKHSFQVWHAELTTRKPKFFAEIICEIKRDVIKRLGGKVACVSAALFIVLFGASS